jgi:WD40 repeat protein
MRSLFVLALAAGTFAAAQEPKKDSKDLPPIPTVDLKRSGPVEYAKDVEPIFANKCFVCHSGNVTEAKFDMSTHAGVLKGGKRGAAVVPGKSKESNLFLFCSRQKKPVMPPKSEEPLSPQEVTIVKLWIDEGAKAPTMAREKPKIVVSLPPALVKPVRAVAVSADGSTVAASRGNQVHLYDKKGEYLRTLLDPKLKTADGKPAKAAHISLVESMAFSPDGKTLATGSFQELTLWDVAKGEPTKRLTGFADRVVAIAYSADGKYLATGGGAPTEDGEIRVFDAASGKQVTDIKGGHSDTVFGVAFSPDGKLLATCAADKFVKVFEVPKGKFVKSFEGHTHHVMGVGWSPDGKLLASCGADNFVKVWDYEKGEKVRDMQGHQKQVTQLAVVGKTPQVVTASGDGTVRMWKVDNGATVRQFPGGGDFLYAVASSADGEVVAAGGEDGAVKVYSGKTGQLVKAAVPPDAEPKKEEKKEELKKGKK